MFPDKEPPAIPASRTWVISAATSLRRSLRLSRHALRGDEGQGAVVGSEIAKGNRGEVTTVRTIFRQGGQPPRGFGVERVEFGQIGGKRWRHRSRRPQGRQRQGHVRCYRRKAPRWSRFARRGVESAMIVARVVMLLALGVVVTVAVVVVMPFFLCVFLSRRRWASRIGCSNQPAWVPRLRPPVHPPFKPQPVSDDDLRACDGLGVGGAGWNTCASPVGTDEANDLDPVTAHIGDDVAEESRR